MCLAQGPQRSDACEARTGGPSILSQALYHLATAPPTLGLNWLIKTQLDIVAHLKHGLLGDFIKNVHT